MKLKKSIIFLVCLFLVVLLNAQKNTYVGFEINGTNDTYHYYDSGNDLKKIPLITKSWGIVAGHEFSNLLDLETGLIRKYYDKGYWFDKGTDEISTGFVSSAIESWQIPLRYKMKMNLYQDKLYLTSTVGYHFCVNSDADVWTKGNFKSGTMTSIFYSRSSAVKIFSLLETAVGVDFKILGEAVVSLSAGYFTGFRNTVEMDIFYSTDELYYTKAYATSTGDYWKLGLGIRYPISEFWRKNK